jgi:hypothetical protein
MARVTAKLPFVSAGSPGLKISDADWKRIEVAYGHSLPAPLRQRICDVTVKLLDWAVFERRAAKTSEAEKRVISIKNTARKLRDVIFRRPGNVTSDADFYARNLICKHAGLPFEHGRDGLQNFALDICKACDSAIADLRCQGRSFRKGDAWNWWVVNLTTVLNSQQLPTGARKDTDKQNLGPSPFVHFVAQLQKCIPPEFRRSTQSDGALSQAIASARAALRRERKPRRPRLNKSRNPNK